MVEGKDYLFRVMAINDVGNGDAIETTKGITIKSPFSKLSKPVLFSINLNVYQNLFIISYQYGSVTNMG